MSYTNQEISDNAVLLAKFEGYEISQRGKYPIIHYSEDNERTAQDTYYHQYLEGWLKPITEKIENLGFEITINTKGVTIHDKYVIIRKDDNTSLNREIHERLYEACVGFVKWYNEKFKYPELDKIAASNYILINQKLIEEVSAVDSEMLVRDRIKYVKERMLKFINGSL